MNKESWDIAIVLKLVLRSPLARHSSHPEFWKIATKILGNSPKTFRDRFLTKVIQQMWFSAWLFLKILEVHLELWASRISMMEFLTKTFKFFIFDSVLIWNGCVLLQRSSIVANVRGNLWLSWQLFENEEGRQPTSSTQLVTRLL